MQHVIFVTSILQKKIMTQEFPHFTESLFYKLEQIARYLELQGKDFFEKLTDGNFTAEEYRTLDVILCNPNICQRDLAKLILTDRVRTGRILDSLENKGLIKRFNDVKNNRLVRKMTLTEEGKQYYEEITQKIQPYLLNLIENFTSKQAKQLTDLLVLLQKALSQTVKIKV